VTGKNPPERRLLRSIYRHLDIPALLAEHPELTRDDIVSLFRTLDRLLEVVPPAPIRAPAPAAGPLPPGALLLYTDGGSRGNPGIAAYGAVLLDAQGVTVEEHGECIGNATNNEAEYRGLLAGLQMAARCGASELVIRSDSELMVHQLNGRYKVKSRVLMPLFLEARRLLEGLRFWRAEHIPRAQNARADQLANAAMDRAKSG